MKVELGKFHNGSGELHVTYCLYMNHGVTTIHDIVIRRMLFFLSKRCGGEFGERSVYVHRIIIVL